MRPLDYIILALVAVLFALSLRRVIRKPPSCGGNCEGCHLCDCKKK